MRIAFIARSTLYTVRGGETIQIIETARHLKKLGIEVEIFLTHEKIDYSQFDLMHFFDVIRPANILYHVKKAGIPFVISPILVDYSEYDKRYRKGVSGLILRMFPADMNEYIKTIARWVLGKDSLPSKDYLWKGHKQSVSHILQKAAMLLPNSEQENRRIKKLYNVERPYAVIPNGIDEHLFVASDAARNNNLVVCAARIEGIKNQLNLIKALNNTGYTLLLIGETAPNQKAYYHECRNIAGPNIIFTGRIEQSQLVDYYRKAKVHVLPSWFETCGLSSLEAAAMGCNIVITDKGFTRDYFEDDAFYCDPENPASIRSAIERAALQPSQKKLQDRVLKNYTWQIAAERTSEAYKKITRSLK